jgi:hypothetical protein
VASRRKRASRLVFAACTTSALPGSPLPRNALASPRNREPVPKTCPQPDG